MTERYFSILNDLHRDLKSEKSLIFCDLWINFLVEVGLSSRITNNKNETTRSEYIWSFTGLRLHYVNIRVPVKENSSMLWIFEVLRVRIQLRENPLFSNHSCFRFLHFMESVPVGSLRFVRSLRILGMKKLMNFSTIVDESISARPDFLLFCKDKNFFPNFSMKTQADFFLFHFHWPVDLTL